MDWDRTLGRRSMNTALLCGVLSFALCVVMTLTQAAFAEEAWNAAYQQIEEQSGVTLGPDAVQVETDEGGADGNAVEDAVEEGSVSSVPDESEEYIQEELEMFPTPENGGQITDVVIDGIVRRGDTAESILLPHVSRNVFAEILAATKDVYKIDRIRENHVYQIIASEKEGLKSFEYHIDRSSRLMIRLKDGKYVASREPIPYDCKLTVVEGTIKSSLFLSLMNSGEGDELGIRMAKIFGSEINFIRDIREGDTYTIVVEKRYREGVFRHYGRILGVRFKNNGKVYEGILFPQPAGGEHYFNAKGQSLHKTILKSPLSFTRVTSGYTLKRRHPIYRDVRPHQGIDYGAPVGTPVKAVGDGTVTRAGWGKGFGNMVIIKHAGGLESMYSHLSRFAKGIKKGKRVKQGQLIAYVGSTGIATGPHLDFRIRQNGKYVNPTKVASPRHDPISRKNRAAFKEQRDFVVRVMEGRFKLEDYKPGMLHIGSY